MRILFVVRHEGLLRNFDSTLRLLAQRGHRVHVAFERSYRFAGAYAGGGVAERLAEDEPGITFGRVPDRDVDPWAALGLRLRLALDYLRYLEPRYAAAPKLRGRAAAHVGPFVRRLGRRAARRPEGLSRLRRLLGRLEAAVPPGRRASAFLADVRPDVVLVSPLVELGGPQTDFVRAAGALSVPSALCVASWDNLTNKGLIAAVPDLVTVWNDAQRREAVELHDVPRERVAVTGASTYDQWFAWSPSLERAEFARRVGLAGESPFLLYLCSSPFIAPDEVAYVSSWLGRLRGRSEPELTAAGVLVRPHPQNAAQWQGVDLASYGDVAVWPRGGADPVDLESRRDYYDSMYHCAGVVGVNTSALIESAIVGRPVHTLLAPEFRDTQGGTLHFAHLVEGGLLRVASSFEEHAAQLAEALGEEGDARRAGEEFLRHFVRPLGLGIPATPLLVEAIERRAAAGAARVPAPSPSTRALRAALAPLAAAAALEGRTRRAAGALLRGAMRRRVPAAFLRRYVLPRLGEAGAALERETSAPA